MSVSYGPGDWFAIPLREGGFAHGLVARASEKGGVVLGYFFGPRRRAIERLDDLADRRAADAVRVMRFGDLSLVDGSWPIVGRSPGWDPEDWPMPHFVRRDPLSGRAWAVLYRDDDPSEVRDEVLAVQTDDYDRDSVLGAGAVEVVMTRMLS